jgi:hypothetical protein
VSAFDPDSPEVLIEEKMQMTKHMVLSTLLLIFALNSVSPVYGVTKVRAKIYLAPQGGFEVYLAAAFTKKHVPVTIVGDSEQADYVLEAAPVEHKPESTGSKVARCLFLYCAGIEGVESASVRLIDEKTKDTVWSYTVNKAHQREQSLAEAIAKHFNNEFISK